MTEQLHFHFSLSCIGEGNGNPLQCSCLENPRDGEPGRLPSLGLHRVRHDWSDLAAAVWRRIKQETAITKRLRVLSQWLPLKTQKYFSSLEGPMIFRERNKVCYWSQWGDKRNNRTGHTTGAKLTADGRRCWATGAITASVKQQKLAAAATVLQGQSKQKVLMDHRELDATWWDKQKKRKFIRTQKPIN